MDIVLIKRSGQNSPLTLYEFDYNMSVIEAAFAAIDAGNNGTVTSVGLSAPNIFVITNSPVTSAGTLTMTLATQLANRVFAGPSSGSAASPTFRSLVADDLPTIPVSKGGTGNTGFTSGRVIISTGTDIIGVSSVTATELSYLAGVTSAIQTQLNAKEATITILPINKGGTGANTAQGARLNIFPSLTSNALKLLRVNAGATDYEVFTLGVGTSGTDITWSNSGSTYSINVPDASASARGVVNRTTQTFDGQKTFLSDIILDSRTDKQAVYINGSKEATGTDDYTYDENLRQLKVGRVRQTTISTISTSTTLDDSYSYVRCEQAGAIDVTLPTPSVDLLGHEYIVKDSLGTASSRNITVKANGSSRLDNSIGGTILINANFGCVIVKCVVTGSSSYVWESISKTGTA